MAKQLNVDLHFNADTSAAKKAIADLQNALTNLPKLELDASISGFTSQIAEGVVEANKLKVALQSAMNVKTGQLDLSKLSQSLAQAGTSINQVSNSLVAMGPVGQKTFQQFAAAIAQVQMPAMRLNGMVGEMWTTLKNVARFQISSSIIHGLVGGIQSAFTYAQNLNESLNNIRIVTGDSSEKMAQFARTANAAAKELSTTTLDYTKASLIYYQQGLNDQQVKERTDVTVKLANVSRQSAQTVSDQMTAIWENFDQGGHSLEYFADVITALGATTASSSQEIAKGLEKFAPVAKTIGLSYETATAALATIVANTRQSADTVGTGLRTIFSRFESLKLGQTLEDGVDLTKYTKALKTVGVEVLDVNGKLKDADTIIFDLADKWKLLDNTQKTALATTVGGVRQYSTLMALFNNWEDMMTNLNTVSTSEGTLQNQADIFAESWEAARNRVRTALQGLYDTLINDDSFISVLNNVENLVTGIDNFVQSIGGAKGAILGISAAVLSFANAGVSNSISNMVYNLKSLTGIGQHEADATRQRVVNQALALNTNGTPVQRAEGQALKNQISLQQTLNQYGRQYNEIQRQVAQTMIQTQSIYDNEVIASEKALSDIERQLTLKNQLLARQQKGSAEYEKTEARITELMLEQEEAAKRVEKARTASSDYLTKTQTSLKNLQYNTMTGSDIFAHMAAGATSAAFAYTALTNTMKTLSDESTTTGEKIQAAFINIPMIATMATSTFKNFADIWKGLQGNVVKTSMDAFSKSLSTINAASLDGLADNTLLIKNNLNNLTNSNAVATLSTQLGLTKAQTAELLQQAAIKTANGELDKEATAERFKQLALEKKMTEARAAGAKAATAAFVKFVAIAAVIAAAVYGITQLVKLYKQDATAAKEDAKAAQEAKEGYEQAKQAQTQLLEDIDKYKEAQNAIDELRAGTEEWRDAIFEANTQILELLNTYPKLAEYIKHDTNGRLTISPEGLSMLQQEQASIVESAYQNYISSSIIANRSNIRNRQTQTGRSIKWGNAPEFITPDGSFGSGQYAASMNQAAVAQLQVDWLVDLWGQIFNRNTTQYKSSGTFTNGEIQTVLNAIKSQGANWQSTLVDFQAGSATEVDQILRNAGFVEAQITALHSNTAALGDLLLSESNLEQSNEVLARQVIDQSYADTLSGNKFGEAVASALTSKLLKSDAGWEQLPEGMDQLYLARQYAQSLGWNTVSEGLNLAGDAVTFTFQDGHTAEVKTAVVNYWANQKAWIEDNEADISGLLQSMQNTYNTAEKKYGKGIANSLLKFNADNSDILEDATRNELSNLSSGLLAVGNKRDSWFYGGGSPNQGQLKGSAHSNNPALYDMLKQYESFGFETAEAYYDALVGATKATTEQFAQLSQKGYIQAIRDIFDPKNENYIENLNNLGYGAATELMGMFNNAIKTGGNEAYQSLEKIVRQLSPEQLEAFMSVLRGMKWDTAGPLSFQNALEATGIAGFNSVSGIDAFANAMRRASQTGLTSAQNIYKSINDLIKDAQLGTQYTPEQWKQFQDAGIEGIEKFFSLMPDGSRILTHSAEEFYEIVSGQLRQNFTEALAEAREQQVLAEAARKNPSSIVGGRTIEGILNSTSALISERSAKGLSDTDTIYGSNMEADIQAGWQAQIESMLNVIQLSGENVDDWRAANNELSLTGQEFNTIFDMFKSLVGNNTLWSDVFQGMENAATEAVKQAEESLGNLDWYSEATRAGLDPSEVLEYAESLVKLDESFQGNIQAAAAFATAQMKVTKGIDQVTKSLKNYQKELKKGDKSSDEFRKALLEVKKGLSNILGVPVEQISDDFVEAADKAGILKDVMNGVKGAVDKLYQFSGDTELAKRLGLDPTKFVDPESLHKAVQQALQTTTTMFKNLGDEFQTIYDGLPKLKPGDLIDEPGMVTALDNVVQSMLNAGQSIGDVMDFMSKQGVEMTLVPHKGEGEADYYANAAGVQFIPNANGGFDPAPGQEISYGSDETSTIQGYDIVYHKKGGNNGGNPPGGGGGGGKQKKKDKPKRDRSARYHEVNRKQSANQKRQSAAQTTADRTVGRTHIKQLERQIQLERESLKLSERKLAEAKKYIKEDEKELKNALKKVKIKLPIEYDADGSIKNYEEIVEELYKREQDLVDKYNAGKISDEEYEKLKKEIDEAREALDNLEESIDAAQEAAEAMVQSINHMLDLELDKIVYNIEFQIELDEGDLKILEHLFDKIDDDVYSTAEAIHLLGDELQVTMDEAAKYEQEYNDILEEMYGKAREWRNKDKKDTELQAMLANYGFYEEATNNLQQKYGKKWDKMSQEDKNKLIQDEAYRLWQNLSDEEIINYLNGQGYSDKLSALMDQILELDSKMDELSEKMREKVVNAFEELLDKEKEQIDVFEHYNTVFDSLANIADLTKSVIGGQNAKALQSMLNQNEIANRQRTITAQYNLWKKLEEDAADYERKRQDALRDGDEKNAKMYEDLAKKAAESAREANEAWLSETENVLQIIQEEAEAAMDDILENFKNALSGSFVNADFFNTIYEKTKEISDSILEDYEKLYFISEMEHQSNKLLDNLDNPKYRKEVLEFQQRLNEYKQAGVKLTQGQIDAEQAWLDLIQARIALEDAQNAKSTVRLQRDNEGNWGYVYTNDSDEIEDAEAKVQKALYEYQKTMREVQKTIEETAQTLSEEQLGVLEQLRDSLINGDFGQITNDFYAEWKKAQETGDFDAMDENNPFRKYYEHAVAYAKEIQKQYMDPNTGLAALYDWMAERLHMTKDEMLELYKVDDASLVADFVDSPLAEALKKAGVQFTSIEDLFEGLSKEYWAAVFGMGDVQGQMMQDQDKTLKLVDMTIDDLGEYIQTWATATSTASEHNAEAVQQLADSFDEEMLDAITAIEEEWDKWLDQLKESQERLMRLAQQIQDFQRDLHYVGDNTGNNPIDTNPSTGVDAENPNIDQTGTNPHNYLIGLEGRVSERMEDLRTAYLSGMPKEEYQALIEQVMGDIKLQAQTASQAFGAFTAGSYQSKTNDTLEQNVHIDASFPNVTNSSEIEAAFENLVNKAAQFANRKRQG